MPQTVANYTMPKLCARCGEQPGNKLWTLQTRQAVKGRFSLVAFLGGRNLARANKFTFTVPVCADCRSQLRQLIQLKQLLLYVALGLLVVGIALELILTGNRNALFVLIMLDMIFLIFGWPAFDVVRIGSFDGKRFHFRNPAFQDAFAKLNPKWVDRGDRKPIGKKS